MNDQYLEKIKSAKKTIQNKIPIQRGIAHCTQFIKQSQMAQFDKCSSWLFHVIMIVFISLKNFLKYSRVTKDLMGQVETKNAEREREREKKM